MKHPRSSDFPRPIVLMMTCGIVVGVATAMAAADRPRGPGPAGAGPFSDYRTQRPGRTHRITPADLPPPGATESVDNGPRLIDRPRDAWPKAPPGFKVELYATGLKGPRLLRVAPNGDLFVAESRADQLRLLRGRGADGRPQQMVVFAKDLERPFGIAFFPPGPRGSSCPTCCYSRTSPRCS